MKVIPSLKLNSSGLYFCRQTASDMTTLPSTFVLGFRRSNIEAVIPAILISKSSAMVPSAYLSFRFGNVERPQLPQRRRLPRIFANPKERDIVERESGGSESGGAQGPPFLTILAGLVVFFFICWVIGSIVMWLIGLIVNVPPSK